MILGPDLCLLSDYKLTIEDLGGTIHLISETITTTASRTGY